MPRWVRFVRCHVRQLSAKQHSMLVKAFRGLSGLPHVRSPYKEGVSLQVWWLQRWLLHEALMTAESCLLHAVRKIIYY